MKTHRVTGPQAIPAKKIEAAKPAPVEAKHGGAVDAAEFQGPIAAKAVEGSEETRALTGLAALKETALKRKAAVEQAEQQHSPAETWSAALLQQHPELLAGR